MSLAVKYTRTHENTDISDEIQENSHLYKLTSRGNVAFREHHRLPRNSVWINVKITNHEVSYFSEMMALRKIEPSLKCRRIWAWITAWPMLLSFDSNHGSYQLRRFSVFHKIREKLWETKCYLLLFTSARKCQQFLESTFWAKV